MLGPPCVVKEGDDCKVMEGVKRKARFRPGEVGSWDSRVVSEGGPSCARLHIPSLSLGSLFFNMGSLFLPCPS